MEASLGIAASGGLNERAVQRNTAQQDSRIHAEHLAEGAGKVGRIGKAGGVGGIGQVAALREPAVVLGNRDDDGTAALGDRDPAAAALAAGPGS